MRVSYLDIEMEVGMVNGWVGVRTIRSPLLAAACRSRHPAKNVLQSLTQTTIFRNHSLIKIRQQRGRGKTRQTPLAINGVDPAYPGAVAPRDALVTLLIQRKLVSAIHTQ